MQLSRERRSPPYVQLWYHALLIVVKHCILRRLDKHRSCRGARGRAEPPSGAGRPAQPGRGSGRARRAEGRGRRATDAQPGARRRRGSCSCNQRSTKRRAGTAFIFPLRCLSLSRSLLVCDGKRYFLYFWLCFLRICC